MHASHLLSETSSYSFVSIIIGIFFLIAIVAIAYFGLSRLQLTTTKEGPTVREYNQVERDLLELGFTDFTLLSLVKFFNLDQEYPFELLSTDDGEFKIRLKLKNDRLITITLYDQSVNFFQIDKEPLMVKIGFLPSMLKGDINTADYYNAAELFEIFEWPAYISGSDTKLYVTLNAHKRIVS
jgi:hypothetical protein